MQPIETIVKALAAGAVANLRPNVLVAEDKVSDDYLAFKSFIQDKYDGVDVDLLDIGPGSVERQQQLREQLEAADAAEDEVLLSRAQALLDVIAAENPKALWAAEEPDTPAHLQ